MANQDDDQTPAAKTGPFLIEGPKAAAGSTDAPIIDLEPLDTEAHEQASAEETASSDTASPGEGHGMRLPRYAPLAAAVTFAIVLGALAGAATTAGLMRDATTPQSVATADATRDLQKTVAHLSTELATLKSGISTAQRSATTQFGKLAERLDRTEKAQVEPTAKIAKIQETVDRLDKRQVAAVAPASDVTGSIATRQSSPTVADARPPIAEGWKVRDFYAGRAIIESRSGMLYEVAPGANVPGLGRVESVKRENGKVTVLTRGGMITAALETRRGSYPLYRY